MSAHASAPGLPGLSGLPGLPAAPVGTGGPLTPRANRGSNRLAGALLAIAAVAVFVAQAALRPLEARVTALAIDPFTAGRAYGSGSTVFFGVGSSRVYGLDITPLCSTVVLVAPLLAIAGVVMVFGLRAQRVALGLIVALALAAGSNLARYIGAAVALQRFGIAGFDLVHEYLGSLLVIFGFAAAIVLLLWIATHDGGRGQGGRRAGSGGRHGGRGRRAASGGRAARGAHRSGR